MNGDEPKAWVTGVGLWLPGVSSAVEFARGARGLDAPLDHPPPTGQSIEPRSRRRASRLSRAMADACTEAIAHAGLDPAQASTVFGSTLGEASTMISLLDQMWRGQEMSPMGFATSVHSAAAGVFSISSANRGFTTSLSADFDTSAAALTEAWGLLMTTHQPVVVVCGDDASPVDFVADHEAFDLIAVALALVPEASAPRDGRPALGQLVLPRPAVPHSTPLPPVETSARVARNPQAGLLDVAAALLTQKQGLIRLDRGLGSGWCTTVSRP